MSALRKQLLRVLLVLSGGFIFFSFVLISHSDDPRITKILNQLALFTSKYRQQKVYVHTDKDLYLAGETIWLKSYAMDAATNQLSNFSNEIYVDLVDQNNVAVSSIILKNTDGVANGNIELPDSTGEGNYQLRAYTNWMKNFDADFLFVKTIRVKNPGMENYLTSEDVRQIKQHNVEYNQLKNQYQLTFFPEGGSLVAGLNCRVAFKAENKLGYGIVAKAALYDSQNKKLLNFETKHTGMGAFSFTPVSNMQYYAKVDLPNGKTVQFDLPRVSSTGIVLSINSLIGDKIRINIQSNLDASQNPNNEVIIVGQSRGEINYISKSSVKENVLNTTVPKNRFPSGITQFTVFNSNGDPVCERLVFISPSEIGGQRFVNLTETRDGESYAYNLELKTSDGKPVSGNLSLAVVENLQDTSAMIWKENMMSNLLLTSDIKGRVENPSDYFNENDPYAATNRDLLMMINGWRRFVWKEILAGSFPALLYTPSEGLKEGEVTTSVVNAYLPKIGSKNYPVELNETFNKKVIRENDIRNKKAIGNTSVSNSGNILYVNRRESGGYSSIVDYMRGRLAGVSVGSTGINVRGSSSFVSGTDPLILRDGLEIGFTGLTQISPQEVESIEVLKGPDASIYGARGANGVIILHMWKGDFHKSNTEANAVSVENVRQFHIAREFYTPAYGNWKYQPSDYQVPKTVYWNPHILVDSTGVATVRLKTKPDLTNTVIHIEGVAKDGSVICKEQKSL